MERVVRLILLRHFLENRCGQRVRLAIRGQSTGPYTLRAHTYVNTSHSPDPARWIGDISDVASYPTARETSGSYEE